MKRFYYDSARSVPDCVLHLVLLLMASNSAALQAQSEPVAHGVRNDLPRPFETYRDWGELPGNTASWAAVTAVEPEEIIIELDPRERRIREAIERHRKARAQKTSDSQASDRQQIEQLLTELYTRATSMNSQSLSAVA